MNKKVILSLFIVSSLSSMEKPENPIVKILSLLPGRRTPQTSPRADTGPRQEPIVAPGKEPSPRAPEDCIILANLALEIDHLYRNSKEIINRERVENAYIKALKCFVQTYEENRKDIDLQLKKLQALHLQIEFEKKQQNPTYVMSDQTVALNKKVQDLLKNYVSKGVTSE